jgi:hypothetical protein
MFNDFDWGGYLIWALPGHRVTLDGRINVSGAELFGRTETAWRGEGGWQSNPELAEARVVVARKSRPLTELLRKDPRFHLSYEDAVAVVFSRTSETAAPATPRKE